MLRRSIARCSATTVLPVPTHTVTNQAPFLEDYNAFMRNARLQECVKSLAPQADDANEILARHGARVGAKANQETAAIINEQIPTFTPVDRQGNRVDRITFHQGYHDIMAIGVENEVPSYGWNHSAKEGGHTVRAALGYMQYQLEHGTACPLTMTYAAVPTIRMGKGNVFKVWEELLRQPHYDRRDIPVEHKKGITCGMSMTEKQGGSDVRANTTTAKPVDDDHWAITGHKWFTSAPMCDGFLTLAKTGDEGLSCFLIPRWVGAERNIGLRFLRIKSKLGDRSNASSEVEYSNAIGYLVGERGHGVRSIIEMVNHTRLDCTLGSAALMQQAVLYATHHAQHRAAFGQRLIDQPVMRNVLADLALEAEAATAVALRVANSFDDPMQSIFKRLATALAKYYVCKRAPQTVYESMECFGGNGYVEEFPLARMFRQAPLNAIWEGSGNVIALDMFRALRSDKKCVPSLRQEVATSQSAFLLSSFDSVVKEVEAATPAQAEFAARVTVERLALLLQAAALYKTGPNDIADAFVESRIKNVHMLNFGTLRLDDAIVGKIIGRFSA